jgi:uncharacterized protein (TIGR03083 family)
VTVHQNLQPYIDAWTHSIEAVSELCAPLAESDWNRATACPGWSVRDVVSHIIGVECELLGDPRPIHSLPRDLRHVVDEASRYNEVPVDVRRCHTGPEMTAELEYVVIRRARQLRNEKRAPDAPARGLMGRETTVEELLRHRVADLWVHEQDLRRALGRPGNLDSPGALITRDVFVATLPEVVATKAGAPPKSAVVFDVHGPVEFMRTVRVDPDGRGRVDGTVSLGPTVTLTMDWETYVLLQAGRIRPALAQVKTEGDEELAGAVLTAMAVTR